MEEDLIIEEGDVMIEKEHTDAPEWIYKEKGVCPVCGRTDCKFTQ